LQWNMLVYFMDIWAILWTFGLFCDNLVFFPRFGMLHQRRSGNPGQILSTQAVEIEFHYETMVC
jgi:hypothetical protein